MRPHYDALLSLAYAGWDERSVASFRDGLGFADPLAFLHELGHWYVKKTRAESAINCLLVRAFISENSDEKICLYRKAIDARKLLHPLSEGICLYLQFDYFPTNYFTSGGVRCEIDALIEVIVASRFSFQHYERLSMIELAERAYSFFIDERLTDRTLKKRMELLFYPLRKGQEHIAGYLTIKRAAANIRSFPRGFYLHDGALLQAIITCIYYEPGLLELILDDDVVGDDFVCRFANVLQEKLNWLLLSKDAGSFIWRFVEFEEWNRYKGDLEALRIDTKKLSECDHKASALTESLMSGMVKSVAGFLRDKETLDEYDNRWPGQAGVLPYPIDSYDFLESMNVVKFGVFNVILVKVATGWEVVFKDYELRLPLAGFGDLSPRAQNYNWLVEVVDGQEARLVEAMFPFNSDFFHVTVIGCERGPLFISHRTDDYNMGYSAVSTYLRQSWRVDNLLFSMREEIEAFEKDPVNSKHREELLRHRNRVYGTAEELLLASISDSDLPQQPGLLRLRDFFQTDTHLASFAALTLIQPMYAFLDESRYSILRRIEKHAIRFKNPLVNPAAIRRYVTKPTPWTTVPTFRKSKMWCSFGTFC